MSDSTAISSDAVAQKLRSRVFDCQQRNKYYENSYELFRKIESRLSAGSKEGVLAEHLREFSCVLNDCQIYANAAIFYGKRKQIDHYSAKRPWGILTEEIIFARFLEELRSSVDYMIKRMETNESIRSFSKIIHAEKNQYVKSNAFVSQMMDKITGNADMEKEFLQLYANIGRRYEIGNKFFSILRELQQFR
jgi:hypothetical protein